MTYSNEFKDLVEKMLQVDPSKRATMEQIKVHPWVKGKMLSYE